MTQGGNGSQFGEKPLLLMAFLYKTYATINSCYSIIVLLSIATCSCDPQCVNREGRREYNELTKIADTGNTKLVSRFSDYPIDKQIDIFLYSKDCPNDPRFEPILARGGQEIIPALVRRIEKEPRRWDKGHLVSVLIRINSQCKCIHDNSEVIETLELVGRAMHADANIAPDDAYMRIYWNEVDTLKTQLKKKPVQ